MIKHINRVFVFGDSHTGAFLLKKSEIPFDMGGLKRGVGAFLYPFVPCYFPGATAHNLINRESKTNSFEIWEKNLKAVNKELDLILLWFGEIDCRYHINSANANKHNKSIDEMVEETIERYFQKIEELKLAGYNFVIMNISPPTKDVGDTPRKERPEIYKIFSDKLIEKCKEKQYMFIDMYSFGVKESGFMKNEMIRDKTHYKPSAIYEYVMFELSKHFIFRYPFYG